MKIYHNGKHIKTIRKRYALIGMDKLVEMFKFSDRKRCSREELEELNEELKVARAELKERKREELSRLRYPGAESEFFKTLNKYEKEYIGEPLKVERICLVKVKNGANKYLAIINGKEVYCSKDMYKYASKDILGEPIYRTGRLRSAI